ncbi:MAG: hypothetical protein ACJA0Z_003692 [Halioglobus sp.]|jgi:hypothetical protein
MPQKEARTQHPFFLTILFWLATTTAALSQPLIEEQQRLNFGTLAIAANASVSRFTYPRTGSNINIEGQFALIAVGSPGLYRFTGFPAYTPLTISLNSTMLTALGGGFFEPLTVDNYDFAELTTDAQGEAQLSLGAHLSTTGNGSSYVDAIYSSTTVLRVDYWQPDVTAFVSNSKTINLETELRSTLTINQEQALSFGTLFAHSSNTSQAALTLAPSGSYTISEPGNSRLISLVKPDQGILRVSGAAPYYSLTITSQVADVLLEHTQSPGSAPHFILSDLVTTPDGTITTGANGELLIKIGGTLKTELTGSPTMYPSGQYEGTYQLTVSY